MLEPGRHVGTILLADISGYSSFLADVQAAHRDDAFAGGEVPAACAMMAGLLEGIAEQVDPPFSVLKFEGDAVFAVATDDRSPRGEAVIAAIEGYYADFVRRRESAGQTWTCTCDACSRQGSLDLKFIVHHGEFVVQRIGSQSDAIGAEVNLAHRLLKNSAVGVVGESGYALFTESLAQVLELPRQRLVPLTETIDGGGEIGVLVVPLSAP